MERVYLMIHQLSWLAWRLTGGCRLCDVAYITPFVCLKSQCDSVSGQSE